MKHESSLPYRRLITGILLSVLSAATLHANPFASSLTNSGGVISFRLNEAADSVKIISNGGATTNDLGPAVKGLTTTNLTVTGPFFVQVKKVGSGQINTNSPVIAFNSPRGVAVNRNPASPYFGRVYVANSAAGTKGDGIYVYNSDLSDVFAGVRTAGLDFAAGGAAAPYRVTVGEDDDRLYIADWSDPAGNLYWTDPDVSTSGFALKPLVGSGAVPVGIDNNHGSVAAAAVIGSIAAGNLKIFTVDEDLQEDRASDAPTQMNSLWRYDVGTGPLPFGGFEATNLIATTSVRFTSQTMDLSRGPNGFLYFSNYRSTGAEAGVFVVTNAFEGTKPYSEVWNSKDVSNGNDILRAAGGISVSPDGEFLAHLNYENNVVTVVRLTNGIPDVGQLNRYTGFGGSAARSAIAFGPAHNIYVAAQGVTRLQSLSLNSTAVATTGTDGTFVFQVAPEVTVRASDPVAHEETPANDSGEFTFTRGGAVAQPLTVRFTVTGTAASGSDYAALPASMTFAAGQTTATLAVSAIDDSLREPAETVVLTISSSEDYSTIGGGSATVAIADNEVPEVSIVAVYTNMYERIDKDFARYRITRVGETNNGISVGLTYQGAGSLGVDFVGKDGANAEAVSLEPGVASATIDLSPVDNTTFSGPRMGQVRLAAALNPGDYVINTTSNSASLVIIDDELGTETVLFSEGFEVTQNDTNTLPATWKALFAATNAAVQDYSFMFGADISGKGFSASPGSATYTVLQATVNKFVTPATAAALNFYPVAKSFSGNFALRMHMLLEAGTASNTEHALFGIFHSGNKTNWFRASTGNVGAGYATNMDGLFFAVNATGGNLNDYMMFTRGTGTGPLTLATRTSASMAHVFKAGAFPNTGAPGASPTPYWTDVEVAHTEGVVSMRLNNQIVFEVVNTNAFASGDIMIGYNDAYDSTGTGGYGYFDNVRVVSVNPPQFTTQPVGQMAVAGGNVTLSVSATGTTGTLSYQWLLNGVAVPNATNATLNLSNLQANQFGNYSVLVSDGRYSSVSAVAAISAAVQPQLTVSRSGNTTTLSFSTQNGLSYVVEYKEALSEASWATLSTTPGTGSTATVTDTTTANARFYRLNVK